TPAPLPEGPGNPPPARPPAQPVDRFGPRNPEDPPQLAFNQPPAVLAAGFDVDVATTTIKVAEGSLLPTISLQGSASKSRDDDPTLGTRGTDQASVVGTLNQ